MFVIPFSTVDVRARAGEDEVFALGEPPVLQAGWGASQGVALALGEWDEGWIAE